ncbi:MAG TPA: ABC transporter ATP-binding protein [Dehalococcoidia bacterium]|nr:ABC transporter ATP-binding protein [Dehalococcoidia bacterium]
MDEILRVEDLRVYYHERERTIRAVDGVSLAVAPGRTLALVGESGCGKTTIALSILDLVPHPGRIESGRVLFEGRDVLRMKREEVRGLRGAEISMIFQDPSSGLNPVLSVGSQLDEMIRTHTSVSKREARRMTLEALRRQRLPDPDRIVDAYPFHLSGGMCQRVMIAIATVLRPKVIIADEPTSALDVTQQAGILRDLDGLKEHLGVAIILITHDLGVVAGMADDVAIMYAGRVVEQAPALDVFERPRHPYSAGLMAARPRVDRPDERLLPIRGAPPELSGDSEQCAFLPRCPKAVSTCRTELWPPLEEVGRDHHAACFNPMFQPDDEPARRA